MRVRVKVRAGLGLGLGLGLEEVGQHHQQKVGLHRALVHLVRRRRGIVSIAEAWHSKYSRSK